jgi:acyl dehydratase
MPDAELPSGPTHVAFAGLPAAAGTLVGVSPWVDITQDLVDRFADLTHDHNFIHVDAARSARESPYRTTIAHGFLTLALLSHLMHGAIVIDGARFGINAGFDRVRMTDAALVGGRLRGRFALAEATVVDGGFRLAWDVTIEQDGAAKPVLVARWLTRAMG